MKKKIIIAISLISIICVIVGVFLIKNSKKKNYVKISVSEYGGTLEQWQYKIIDEDIVDFKEVRSKNLSDDDVIGNEIKSTYYFIGKKEGRTRIVFYYGASNAVWEVKAYDVIVNSNLKMELKEIEIKKYIPWNYKRKHNWEIENNEIINYCGYGYDENGNEESYCIVGVKEGKTNFKINYYNDNGEVEFTEIYDVIVDHNLNVDVVKKDFTF